VPFMSLFRSDDGTIETGLTRPQIAAASARRQGLLWVHVTAPDDDDASLMRQDLGLHPLAVQDCLNPAHQRPKIEDFGSHLFLVLRGIDHAATAEEVLTTELDLFVGEHFVVSSSLRSLPSIQHVMETALEDTRILERGTPLVTHAIIDAFVDAVAPTIDRMEDVADAIDDDATIRPSDQLLAAIRGLRRSALRLHRLMEPQREVVARLAHNEYPVIGSEHGFYFRDVLDHINHIEDACEGLRERADFALTTYLSTLSIRQNETMRLLSIVAAVFLPLTLIAGIYGMNFEHMPELTWRYGYFFVLAGMATFAVVVGWWLWGRRLVHEGRARLTAPVHFSVEPRLLREARLEATRLRLAVLDLTHFGGRDPDDEVPGG
jgi:magnesium transporter